LSFTGGGRFNSAQVNLNDQLGTALTSSNHFNRFNPMIGATYAITPNVSAYAGYSEANRAPTPLELGCADPNHPCIIDNFLVSDPSLKQVVARTVEAGLRGNLDLASQSGRINWKAGVYRTDNSNDILNVPSAITGFGYFTNVGATRRQGVELEADYHADKWLVYASYAYVDATFRTALTLSSPSNPYADVNGNIYVVPGDHIASIPRNRLKLGADYDVTDQWKVGGDFLYVGSQYYQGDESNQNPQLPGYWTVNLHTSYQITKNLQIYGLINNLFDKHYYTFARSSTRPRSRRPISPIRAA